jgi:hypothetical protein
MHELEEVHTTDLFLGITGNLDRDAVGEGKAAVRVRFEENVAGTLDEEAIALLALLQLFRHPFGFGHVPRDRVHNIVTRSGTPLQPAVGAVLVAPAVFEVDHVAAFDQRLQSCIRWLDVVGVDEIEVAL